MVNAAPFAALRYDPDVAGDPASTSAPAYDDVGRFTYAQHRTASPYTVLELLAGDDGGDEAYAAAGAAFRRWMRTGVLVQDTTPAYYLYEIHELRSGVPAVLRGILAAVDLAEGNLLPHEAVDEQRVAARARRMGVVPADLAPVFAVHTPASPQMRAVVDRPPQTPPIIAFTDEAGADHRVWALRDPAEVEAVRRGLTQVRAVIADGHHRYAAAVHRAGPGSAGRTLTYLVDGATHGPQLRPVHRIVRPAPDGLVQRLDEQFEVTRPTGDLEHELARHAVPAFGLRLPGAATAVLVARDPEALRRPLLDARSAAWAQLDAGIWEHTVRPLVVAGAVSYRADAAAAAAEVDATGDAALFLLRPPRLRDVFACALAGEPMPAKSTWFRPKPRAGVVMRSLDLPG